MIDTTTLDILKEIKYPDMEEKKLKISKPTLPKTISKLYFNIPATRIIENMTYNYKLMYYMENPFYNDLSYSTFDIEYFGDIDKYFFSEKGLGYLKAHHNDVIELSICGIELSKSIPSYLKGIQLDKEIPQLGISQMFIPTPSYIGLKLFKEPKIVKKNDKVFFFVNIPYNYYKDIYQFPHTLNYDFKNEIFTLFGYPYEEYEKMFYTQVKELFDNKLEPIVLRQQKGTIVAVESDYQLFISKMYKIPYIPAVIVTEEKVYPYEELVPEAMNIDVFNKVCYPYLIVRD